MFTRRIPIVLLLLIKASILLAQIPQKIIFSRLTKKEGLASESVFQTVQDKTGFIWIATQNGLQRYDGNRFITFRHIPGDSNSIADNSVNHLFLDSKNRLWLLFEKGLGIFNTSNNVFTAVKLAPNVNLVKRIEEDHRGRLILVADYNKRFLFNEQKREFTASYPLPPFPGNLTAGDIIKASVPNRYWLTGKQGLFLYDEAAKRYTYKDTTTTSSDPIVERGGQIQNARLPFVAKDGNLWMVSWIPFGNVPTLYCLKKDGSAPLEFKAIRGNAPTDYYEIWGIYQQTNGTLWIYGMGMLAYFDPQQQRFINVQKEPFAQYGVDYDYVSNLFEDREHNIWVSTNKGLFYFNISAQVFANISNHRPMDTAITNVPVTAIFQTKDNTTWISTWGAGVFSYDKNWQPVSNPVDELSGKGKFLHASFMTQRRNGEIWTGTRTSVMKIYEPSLNKLTDVPVPVEQNDGMRQVMEDDEGNMWIGTDNGVLLKSNGGDWRKGIQGFRTMFAGTVFGDILKLYVDRKNFLWVCTGTQGVYKIDKKQEKIIQHFGASTGKNDGLLNEGATDIVQYNDSLYLLASNGLCILNSRTNTFQYLTAADGLPAENIINIIIDKQNRIWIALAGGIYRLNLEKKIHVEYDAASGITNNIFEVSTAAILNNGEIAMGTPYDFILFDPARTIDTMAVPPVTITGITSSGKPIPTDSVLQAGKLVLPHDNTSIGISLSTLSFRKHYSIYYMLKGIDTSWHMITSNDILYPYLPPGSYTLLLKAVNGEGEESRVITSLPIEVNKPFWLSWWFYSLLALVLMAVLFWFDKERMAKKEALQTMRADIAGNLHKDINTALSDINVLSEMAKLKADKEPHKSIEFIEQIHARSYNMINVVEDMMWAISPENDSMQKALDRFREHVDALRNTHGARIDLLIDKKVEMLNLNMKQRQDIYWLLKNGITNMVRTGAADVRVHLGLEKSMLVYTLEFDNSSMNMQQFNNLIQRKELGDKLKEVHGKLDINTVRNNTAIELKLPV